MILVPRYDRPEKYKEGSIRTLVSLLYGIDDLNDAKNTESYPSYTKSIMDRSNVYFKDGVCIKNRGGLISEDLTSVIENIVENDLNEIVIEKDGLVKIYTKDSDRYKDIVKYLIDLNGLDILEKIKFKIIK